MTMRFTVEGLVPSRGVVVARKLEEDEDVLLTPNTTLDGHPVKGFDIPRVIGAGGKLRRDLFGFFLSDPTQVENFRIGTEVKLES